MIQGSPSHTCLMHDLNETFCSVIVLRNRNANTHPSFPTSLRFDPPVVVLPPRAPLRTRHCARRLCNQGPGHGVQGQSAEFRHPEAAYAPSLYFSRPGVLTRLFLTTTASCRPVAEKPSFNLSEDVCRRIAGLNLPAWRSEGCYGGPSVRRTWMAACI